MKLAAGGMMLATGLLLVVPDFGGCGEPTLHWIVAEPIAQWMGIHEWFRSRGPLAGGPGVVASGALALGVGATTTGWASLVASRTAGRCRGGPLAVFGAGLVLSMGGLWATICWNLL